MKKYAPLRATIGGVITGVCTVILCIGFYYFLNKTDMPITQIVGDMGPGLFITPFICGLIQIKLKTGSTLKGKETVIPEIKDQATYVWMPKTNKFAFNTVISLVSMVIWTFIPVGILFTINPDMVMGRWVYIVFKSCCGGLSAGWVTYHVSIVFPYITKAKAVAEGTWQYE